MKNSSKRVSKLATFVSWGYSDVLTSSSYTESSLLNFQLVGSKLKLVNFQELYILEEQ